MNNLQAILFLGGQFGGKDATAALESYLLEFSNPLVIYYLHLKRPFEYALSKRMNVETTYNVKLVSFANSVVLIMALLVFFLTSAAIFIPKGGLQNTGLSILATALSLGFGWLMWQIFVTGRTQWTLNNNGLNIAWTKQFAFCKNPDIVVPWSEIRKISKGLDPNYYILKIDLINDSALRFIHDPMVTRDDFQMLITAINEKHHLA